MMKQGIAETFLLPLSVEGKGWSNLVVVVVVVLVRGG
jgi:hypothetical protein